jgi:hypothetical protein
LLIGIDKYTGVPSLVGSVHDVQKIRRFAQTYWGYRDDQIKVLLDEQATRNGMLAAIDTWLIRGSQPRDRVLFYYSGHGSQIQDTNGDEEDGYDETLVSVDTRVEQGMYRDMVLDDELQMRFNQLHDRQVTIIIDSCHSGTATRVSVACEAAKYHKTPVLHCGTRALPVEPGILRSHRQEESFLPTESNRVVWSAASAAQVAFVHRSLQPPGGVFTHHFVTGLEQGLADRNKNGVISHAEMLEYVREQSDAYCQQLKADCPLGLTPSLEAAHAVLKQAVVEIPQPSTPAPVWPASVLPSPPPAPLAQVATDVLAHGNDSQVQVEVLPAPQVRVGTPVRIRVHSERDGYVIVLAVDAQSQLRQLFPNTYSLKAGRDNRIYARRPLTIPDAYYGFDFKAAEPVGPGTLWAVVTEDPVDLQAVVTPYKDLQVIPNGEDYLTTLAARLQEPWRQDTANRQTHWSLGKLDFTVLP